MLGRCGLGFGGLALTSLLAETGFLAQSARGGASTDSPLAPKMPHFAPKAKRVVHIFLNGGCSHIDTFDPKPELTKRHGQPLPSPNLSTERPTGAALGSPFQFSRYGECGREVSELFRHVAESADELCIIRSLHADVPNHEPSLMLMNCGDARQVRPSVGSWVTYGLGAENQNLPGFIVMCPGGYPIAETQNWHSGFLPGAYQGTYIDPVHTRIDRLIENIDNRRISMVEQRGELDLLSELNRRHAEARPHDPLLEGRIQSFELAYRMQMEATDAFDVDREPAYIREMYGPGVHARMMLSARRLLERGVRYIQIWHGEGQPWDSHDDLKERHAELAGQCDRPIGAFLKDLKARGMLDDTLVFCCGEFGRTPTVELPTPGANAGKMNGRDHNHYGFTVWLAGGGVKGGTVYGATDEFGFKAVENPVHIHDLHATILHLLGFDHERFTYRFAGRDFRLTDVAGRVVREILA
jgi:hypothetical protein